MKMLSGIAEGFKYINQVCTKGEEIHPGVEEPEPADLFDALLMRFPNPEISIKCL